MALIGAGKYDDQQRYFIKERQKWEEENQREKRKKENYVKLQKQTEQVINQSDILRENLNRPGEKLNLKVNLQWCTKTIVGGKKLEEIKSVTFEEAVTIMKKGDAKAVVVGKEGIKIVDLPDYGIAGLRMVASRLDRVEYNYTKK